MKLFRRHPIYLLRRRDLPPAPFIVGSPRSGTTLLRLMLDAHPDLAIPPETGFLADLTRMSVLQRKEITAEKLLGLIAGFHTWPDFGLEVHELWRCLHELRSFSLASGVRAFYEMYSRQHGKTRWGDKTPTFASCMPGIQDIIPEAHFIHIIRDGRDVALSLRDMWFSPSSEISVLAQTWDTAVRTARRDGATCHHYVEVLYEDLVRNPGAVLRELCSYLHLEFRPSMLQYHLSALARLAEIQDQRLPDGVTVISRERRLAQHPFVTSPPDEERINRWRKEMSSAEIAVFEESAGRLLSELGYETAASGR